MQYPNRIIKTGEADEAIVTAVQEQLKAKGISPLDVDGEFGAQTEAAVKLFQARNTDTRSRALTQDGKVGPSTWAALFGNATVVFPPSGGPSPFAMRVIAMAAAETGTQEIPDGSNAGPRVEEYLRSVGLGKGFAWCMAFVYWCVDQAAKAEGKPNPLVKTAGVLDQWTRTTATKIKQADALANFALVKPGQVFIMDFGQGHGHTGFIESVNGNQLITLEGNTNKEGSREGNGVFRRTTRTIRSINKGFIEIG